MSEGQGARTETATLAGGCFWCLEAVFEQLRGVQSVQSGYTGGATPNRQGGDVGTQYRSAIFYHSPEQDETAESVMKELVGEGLWRDPVVTELVPLDHFYPAETYHDEYFRTHPNQPYCRAVIEPKVAKFRKKYLDRLKG
jgi:peptide-methionine (S)-S-oxide reductase